MTECIITKFSTEVKNPARVSSQSRILINKQTNNFAVLTGVTGTDLDNKG